MPVAKLNRLFEERLNHLRILTVHCIECIYQWKQFIEPQLPKQVKIKYLYNGKCYMGKIVSDYMELMGSRLQEVYVFEQKKHDYFFLHYTYEGKKMSLVSKSIIKRIRLCEMLLAESEEDEEPADSKRTPLIHKLRSPHQQRADKSMPPKAIVARTGQKWNKLEIEYSDLSDFFASSVAKSAFVQSFRPVIEVPRYEEITIFQNSETGEEVVLGVDRNASQRKIVILSIKSTLEIVEAGLKSLCEYLW